MVGVNGTGVVTYKKPDTGKEYPAKILPTSDEFADLELGMQWGWNHNPDSTKWTLQQNPGYLRHSTAKIVSHLPEVRNTLTQRLFAYYSDTVATAATIKMDIEHMKEGDIAGLAVFQDPYAYIGIKQKNGLRYVIMVNNGEIIDSAATDRSIIYLRARAVFGTSIVSFSFSRDNQSFIKLGNELLMQFNLSVFTGNKFGLFNYATQELGGYVDFDWFRTDIAPVQ
jgi:beta-xylosidase